MDRNIPSSTPELIAREKLRLNQAQFAAVNSITKQMNKSLDDMSPDDISYIQVYLEQVKIAKINDLARVDNRKFCKTVGDGQLRSNRSTPINSEYNGCIPPNGNVGSFEQNPPIRGGSIQPIFDRSNTSNTRNVRRESDRHNSNVNNNANTQSNNMNHQRRDEFEYVNPYEYGARQNQFGSLMKPTYTGPFDTRPELLQDAGITMAQNWETFPGQVRNINVESALVQSQTTKLPGQRELTATEMNRFMLLPFDPQDTTHIVWSDNMPRSGYPTRVDRLEQL